MHLTISCDTCVARHTAACDDCVVTFFCGPEPTGLELDDDEREAVAGLAAAGLVPDLRYRPTGPAAHPSGAGARPAATGARPDADPRTAPRRHPGLRLVTSGGPGSPGGPGGTMSHR